MSDRGYTPSDLQVRIAYCYIGEDAPEIVRGRGEAFDSWLAAHDAVIREDELKATAQEFLNAANAGVEPELNRLAAKLLFRRATRTVHGGADSIEGASTTKAIRGQSFTGTEKT